MKIKITQKDIEKASIQNTPNGELIDEIAYSADQPPSDCIYDYNEYVPEPYNFDFETDLLANTKTQKQLESLCKSINFDIAENTIRVNNRDNLQAGAYYALNYPDKFQSLLEVYTQAVKDQDNIVGDIVSLKYAKEKEEVEQDYYDQQYKEWLNGDYSGHYRGVLHYVLKEYGATSLDYSSKDQSITFMFDKDDFIEKLYQYYGSKSIKNAKKYLLMLIKENSDGHAHKDKQEREKRKAERERLNAYKAEQKAKADAERKAKLLSMKLNKN